MKVKSIVSVGRNVCPVCGKVSYSRGGVHPQCSVTRADTILRAARKIAEEQKLQADGLKVSDQTLAK